jgi:Na+/proline symporter
MLDIAFFVAYIGLVLGIGRYWSKRIRSAEDFHLCGRDLGKLPASLSLAATEFSGSGLIGGAGLVYAIGLSGIFWNYAAIPAYILLGILVAPRLRRLRITTIPEYIGTRFGVNTQRLTAVLEIVESVAFVAVQILVSAFLLSALFPVTVTQASLIVTAAFAIYTMMGGLWAVVWTDALQYVVLMAGIIIAVILALKAVGGVDGLHTSLPGEYFSFTQLGLWTPLAWGALALYSYGVDQAYMQRALAAKDPETARFAYLFTAGNYVVFGACVACSYPASRTRIKRFLNLSHRFCPKVSARWSLRLSSRRPCQHPRHSLRRPLHLRCRICTNRCLARVPVRTGRSSIRV